MEIYRTKDNQVSKFIHNDGSETAIKTVASCGNIFNKITDKIEPIEIDRNKYSVFISTSVGCPINCKFCYLAVKKYPYYGLSANQIINNVKEAITEEVKHKPELRKKFIKLSFMGMGDAFLLDPKEIRYITNHLVKWIIGDNGFAFGLDGVDIGTTMPRWNSGWSFQFALLNEELRERFKTNPQNNYRSIVRIFYSLHDCGNMRKSLIPNSVNSFQAVLHLQEMKKLFGFDIIYHYMFLKNINDRESWNVREYAKLIDDSEVRILRYNKCKNSPYEESDRFNELVKEFSTIFKKIKYQISVGSEIKASCGQFICKGMK